MRRHERLLSALSVVCASCTFSFLDSTFSSSTAVAANLVAASETVVIHADQESVLPSVQGFLYSGDDLDPEAVAPLRIRHWRTNLYASRATYDLLRSFDARITYVLSDALAHRYGGYPNLRPWENWPAYEDFVRLWAQRGQELGFRFDYWDIWNEPNNFWHGTPEQFFEMLFRTIVALRSVDPSAKVVVPSQSGINGYVLDYLLNGLLESGVSRHMSAMSWHEFGLPENIPAHAEQVRSFFQNHASDFCQPECPEIHVNEFSSGQHDLIPGWALGWLYYLEQARVDWASKACWQIVGGSLTSCWHGLGGLFTADGGTPQHTYWVYRNYGELPNRRLRVNISAPRTVALAGRDDARRELRVLVGRYSCGQNGRWCKFSDRHVDDTPNPSADVDVQVQGYPFNSSRVEVQVQRIPNEGIPGPLPAPLSLPSSMITVRQGVVNLRLTGVGDGDVYLLVLNPK